MAASRTSSARAVAMAVLAVTILAVALRGHVPGSRPVSREPVRDSPVGLAFVGVLFAVALAVMAAAVIFRLRHRRSGLPGVTGRPDWYRGGGRGRISRRFLVIAFAVGTVWLVLVAVLTQLGDAIETTAPGAATPPTAEDAPPADDSSSPAVSPSTEPDSDESPLDVFTMGTVIFLVLLAVGTVVAKRRPGGAGELIAVDGREVAGTDPGGPESESLARAAEIGLATVGDLSREPRKAIIACFAAMERELATVPGAAPQDFDTASEVLARAVEHGALQPDSAVQLVELFDEARFSPHLMNEAHRDTAVRILELVLDELRTRV